jgi:7-cyano-7-deazaguanine synthase
MTKRAVVLLSGGLDSAVVLYYAIKEGYSCYCLAFDYGQRHVRELESAKSLAGISGSPLTVPELQMPWKGSSLVDTNEALPQDRSLEEITSSVPSTYVPARNTIFLSNAASLAEAIGADAIFIGAHFEDSSGYPDCRESYLEAFNKVIELGTKRGSEKKLKIEFPLIKKTKKEIIELGFSLEVPFELTWSCYRGGKTPCGRCDSCILRAKGFREAARTDPLLEKVYA